MLKIEKNLKDSFICGQLTKFLLIKLILRPPQQSDFDMLVLKDEEFPAYRSCSPTGCYLRKLSKPTRCSSHGRKNQQVHRCFGVSGKAAN
jgi:hypothetical protein